MSYHAATILKHGEHSDNRTAEAQGENWTKPDGDIVTLWNDSALRDCNFFPPYLTSYDAIIPLIQKQSVVVRAKIARRHSSGITFMSSPAQLCEALLRATGKYEE